MQIDANKVIENLIKQVGQYARDLAISQAQMDLLKEELEKKEGTD